MILSHDGKAPRFHPSARVVPGAIVCGDVEIGENCSVGSGAVIVAESGPVRIGNNVVIMETAELRGVQGAPLQIGDNVLIGPRAYLSGCDIGSEAFIATGAAIFNRATVGTRAEVRVNGAVHVNSSLPPDATVPISWVAVGAPAQIFPPEAH